jgi:uncharacterized membrane protein (UPF0136 family)
MPMSTAPGMSGATVDALRMQIETELRAESRRRRLRVAMAAAALLLLASLVLNLIVLTAPGAVGLASAGELDGVRQQATATAAAADQRAEETLALTQAATRRAARADAAARPVPAICTALAGVGAWSYVSGQAPALGCPSPP